MNPPIDVFVSYAPADEPLWKELEKHLAVLENVGAICTLDSHKIGAGENWQEVTAARIDSARVIILLLSSDFFASNQCYSAELDKALNQTAEGKARLIPIRLRSYDWEALPFKHLRSLPSNGTPIANWSNRDDAWAEIAREIRVAVSGNPTKQPVAKGLVTEDPARLVYGHLIEATTEFADLHHWEQWTCSASSPRHAWRRDMGDRLFELHRKLDAAIWPGELLELEAAVRSLKDVLGAAFNFFGEHCNLSADGMLRGHRFYQIPEWDPPRYRLLLDKYNAWSSACDELLHEATRAANWFAAIVRRDVDKNFFLLHGKFSMVEGPYMDLSFGSTVYEYSIDELRLMPNALQERVLAITHKYTQMLIAGP